MRRKFTQLPRLLMCAALLALAHPGCSTDSGHTTDPGDVSHETWDVGPDGTTCPQGQVPDEAGNCVDAPSLCKSWQMPTVDGACVNVGPRACSKLWNPQSSAACEPDQLLDCPEGTVESQDSSWCRPLFEDCGSDEIPILGGGCKAVGVTEAQLELDEPYFDECPPRLLALLGGGCATVGPQGCEKTWNPDSDESCETGENSPCPDGWVPGEEDLFCQPHYALDCPDGHLPALGGGCQAVIDFSTCPAGPFPDPPDNATQILFVDAASTCTTGCGSAGAPYPSLQQAVASAAPDSAVLIAAGTYTQGLAIDKPLTIRGVCADKVFISGSVPVSDPDGDSPPAASIVVQPGSGNVTLSHMTVSHTAAGLAAVGPEGLNDIKLHLSNLAFSKNAGVALYLKGLSVEGVGIWVHEVLPSTVASFEGRGIMVRDGASLSLSQSLIEKAHYFSVDVTGDNITVQIHHSTVRNTLSGDGFLLGAGINVNGNQATTKVNIKQSLLESNASAQVRVQSGELRLGQCLVRNGATEATGERGYGLVASSKGRITAEETVIANHKLAGVLAVEDSNPEFPKIHLDRCAVVETKEGLYGTWEDIGGVGINVNSGGTVLAQGTLVWDSRSTGALCSDTGSTLALRGSLVGHTLPEVGTGAAGMGVQIQIGCTGLIEDTVIESNTYGGLVCVDTGPGTSGTEATVLRSTIRGADPESEWWPERGIEALDGGQVKLADSLVEKTGEIAFMCNASGTGKAPVSILNSVLRHTLSDQNGAAGHGLYAMAQCNVMMVDCLLDGNSEAAIQLLQDDTSAQLVGIIVRNTVKSEAYGLAMALDISTGASATVERSLIEENDVLGIGVEVTDITGIDSDKPASLAVISSIIRKQRSFLGPDGGQHAGRGIEVQRGGQATVDSSLLDENSGVGILVGHPDSALAVEDSIIRNTRSLLGPAGEEEAGHGIQILDGGSLDLSRCLVEGNAQVGVSAHGDGSQAALDNCLVQDQVPFASGKYGWGIAAQEGGSLVVSDSLIRRNVAAGVRCGTNQASVTLERSVVSDTLPDVFGEFGRGIEVGYGGIVEVRDSLLERNTEVGLNAGHAGTHVSLSRTVIRETLLDPTDTRGQAVNLQQDANMTATACLFEENAQSGLAVTLDGTAELVGIIVRNTNPALAQTVGGEQFADGGFALAAVYGSQVSATHSLFDTSATVGLFAEGDDAWFKLTDCAVVGTAAGGGFVPVPGSAELEFQSFGDGIFISLDASLTADRVLVYDNARCGLYWRGSGTMSNSVVLGNTAFGIAIDKQTKGGAWEDNGNQVFGNCSTCSGFQQVHDVDVEDGTLVPVLGSSLGITKDGSGTL